MLKKRVYKDKRKRIFTLKVMTMCHKIFMLNNQHGNYKRQANNGKNLHKTAKDQSNNKTLLLTREINYLPNSNI